MLNYQDLCQQMENPPFSNNKRSTVYDIMCRMEVHQYESTRIGLNPVPLPPHDNDLWEQYWVRMKIAVNEISARGSIGRNIFMTAIAPLRAEIFGRRQP